MTSMANDTTWYEEDNDCSVVALSRIAGISYNQAHTFCKANGREDKVAMGIGEFFKAIKATGADILGFNVGSTLESITSKQKNMTVKQASKAFADRHGQNFVLMTNDHVIAVCDGEMDESEVKNYARKKVKVICEVLSPEEAKSIRNSFDRWGETYHETDHAMSHHVYWEAL